MFTNEFDHDEISITVLDDKGDGAFVGYNRGKQMITVKQIAVSLYLYLFPKEYLYSEHIKNRLQNQLFKYTPAIIWNNTQTSELPLDPDDRDWEYDGYGIPRCKDTFMPK